MVTHQKCLAEKRSFSIAVPSSKGGEEYEVKGTFENGVISCTCKGFQFNGTCRHTKFDTIECGWNGAESPEVQSLEQKKRHECPRCGRRTVDVASGNF